jgi:hypothetical protein
MRGRVTVSIIRGNVGASFFPSQYSNAPTPQSKRSDLSDFYSDSAANLNYAFGVVASNHLSNTVDLAAQMAAKRLGVKLPGSTGTTATAAAPKKVAAKTGATSAHTNIDQFLASLDGVPKAPVTSASGAAGSSFNLDSYLSHLDAIASGSKFNTPPPPSGKNFSIDSYMASLDRIAARPIPVVSTTA